MVSRWTKLALALLTWSVLAVPALAADPAGTAGSPAVAMPPGPSSAVGPLIHITQTLNNCGPASVAEVLHYWGIERTQEELSPILRRGNPVGMSTDDVADYVQSIGLNEYIGGQGSDQVIKALVANGLPVIVAQLTSDFDSHPHFRPVEAYDDAGHYFVSSDPLLGAGYRLSYSDFDRLWRSSDGVFLVIFPESMRATLLDTLSLAGFSGPSWISPSQA